MVYRQNAVRPMCCKQENKNFLYELRSQPVRSLLFTYTNKLLLELCTLGHKVFNGISRLSFFLVKYNSHINIETFMACLVMDTPHYIKKIKY